MKSTIKRIKLFYFTSAIVGSLSTTMLPLFYLHLNFSNSEMGMLLSASFFGSILQPIYGYYADAKKNPKLIMKNCYFGVMIFSGILFFASEFKVVFFLAIAISVCRAPLFGLADDMIVNFTRKEGINFGSLRSMASIGYGSSMLIALPFTYFLGVKYFLIILIIACLFSLVSINSIPNHKKDEPKVLKQYLAEIKILFKSSKYIAFTLYNCLFMSVIALRLNYQGIRLEELSGNNFLPAIALLFCVLPEVVLLKRIDYLRIRISFLKFMIVPIVITIFQLWLFYAFDNIYVLLFASALHGIIMSFHIPGFISFMHEQVNREVSSTAMLSTLALQALSSFFVNSLIITPVYVIFGIKAIFLAMIVLVILAIIPLIKVNKILRSNNEK